jgi:Holliday junction resolvasome RuvABC ATP-dependent DNA helicase subunit
MDEERIIDGQPAGDDHIAENAIRPRTLAEYIGQGKLRADWIAAQGGREDWHAFHDAFLSRGAPPIPLVRAALLGAEGGPPL